MFDVVYVRVYEYSNTRQIQPDYFIMYPISFETVLVTEV